MRVSASFIVTLTLGGAASVSAYVTTVGFGNCIDQTTLPPVTKTQAAYTQTITEPVTLTTVRLFLLFSLIIRNRGTY